MSVWRGVRGYLKMLAVVIAKFRSQDKYRRLRGKSSKRDSRDVVVPHLQSGVVME